jgi:hypothetical protein
MSERYQFNRSDLALVKAAVGLLKKAFAAESVRPAQLVSIAKLLHVLSVLPRVTSGIIASASVSSPRRTFGEIETWHWWDVEIENERLSISSGGHFYRESTGGDTFTTMRWVAIPEEPAQLDDYSDSLWMVPDLQRFSDAVEGIDFASGLYKVEVTDSDNPLLEDDDDTNEQINVSSG